MLLETVGGHQTLVDIMVGPATTNWPGTPASSRSTLLRRLIGVAGEIAEIGYGMPDDVTKAFDRAEALVYDVNQRRYHRFHLQDRGAAGLNLDRLEQLYGRGDAVTGVPTGYRPDELLSGLQPSNLGHRRRPSRHGQVRRGGHACRRPPHRRELRTAAAPAAGGLGRPAGAGC